MDRAQKRQLVSTLNEEWKGTGVMVIAHYKVMTVAQMTDFRKRICLLNQTEDAHVFVVRPFCSQDR